MKHALTAIIIQASDEFADRVGQADGDASGRMEAATVKATSVLRAEWVTREAMQN